VRKMEPKMFDEQDGRSKVAPPSARSRKGCKSEKGSPLVLRHRVSAHDLKQLNVKKSPKLEGRGKKKREKSSYKRRASMWLVKGGSKTPKRRNWRLSKTVAPRDGYGKGHNGAAREGEGAGLLRPRAFTLAGKEALERPWIRSKGGHCKYVR